MATYKMEAPAEGSTDTGSDDDRPRKKFSIIPEGTWVDAEVLKVDEVEKPYKDDDGNPVKKVEFTFGFSWEGEDRKAWGETSTKFVYHPGCKLRNWAQEILSAELPEEFVLNTDHLEGGKCQVRLAVRSWDAGSKGDKTWAAGSKNYVDDVKRIGNGAVAAAPAPAAAAYDDPF
jgi:hypothetical protein